MTAKLFTLPKQTPFSNAGALIPGAKAYFYINGTSTPQDTYTASDLLTANPNPVVADGNGVFPAIYLDDTLQYKVKITDASDVELYTEDDFILDNGVRFEQTAAELSAGVAPSDYSYEPGDVRRYGAVGDGVADDSAAIQSAIDVAEVNGGKVLGGPGDSYYLGTLAGDATKFQITADIRIDFSANTLTITGTDGSFTDCKCFQFFDCVADISIGSFEDLTFTLATSTSRGVQPVNIRNSTIDTKGHRVGPMHVVSGQSILTASTADVNDRASDIQLVGPCTADEAYYGINLANNGDRVRGDIFVNAYNRLVFVYGVDDVDISAHGGDSPSASSSCIRIWRTTRDTTNIKVRAVLEEINGLVRISDYEPSSSGNGVFTNIDVTLHVKSYGANLPSTSNEIIAIGTESASSWEATSNLTIDNLRFDFESDVQPDVPFKIQTTSPNYGEIETPGISPVYSQIVGFRHKTNDAIRVGITAASLEGAITGATQANPVVITETAHGRADGEDVAITGITGMTEINDRVFTVANATADTYELSGEDGSGHTAYTSGGTAHAAVAIDVDDLTYDNGSTLWALAVDSISRFDTSFSGQKTAVERWSVHGYTSSGSDAVITAQNKAHLSQSGGDSPVGAFVAADSGSVIYNYMTGYVSTNGRITVNYRMLG